MEHVHVLLMLTGIFGFFMAWGIGANDVANAMGTAVGSKALSIKQAVIIAAIFETAGAILAGGEVTNTIRGGIIDSQLFINEPEMLIYGMLASLLAAGLWLAIASMKGWPVSTTHSIVGAIIGFALIKLGSSTIHWIVVLNIALSWVVTPMIAGLIGYVTYRFIVRFIFDHPNPTQAARRIVPCFLFLQIFLIVSVVLFNGLKHLQLPLLSEHGLLYTSIISLGLTLVCMMFMLLRRHSSAYPDQHGHKNIENTFATMMIFMACAMAFAHGSNDIANAVGPIAVIVNIIFDGGKITENTPLPSAILFFGAAGIVVGLATYGYKVIATIGKHITELTPSRGFAASLATASTVVVSSGIGLPISTSQTLVGAVLGVGLARGIFALNLTVIRNIFMSWLVTVPAGAILSIIFFIILNAIF
jgi:inorganic phosphate transporter, PiT family